MFQNKSHPIVSEDAEETKPVSKKRGKPDWEKMHDALIEVIAEELLTKAIDPVKRLRKQIRDLKAEVASLREKVPSGDHSRIDVLAALTKRRCDDLESLVARLEKEQRRVSVSLSGRLETGNLPHE